MMFENALVYAHSLCAISRICILLPLFNIIHITHTSCFLCVVLRAYVCSCFVFFCLFVLLADELYIFLLLKIISYGLLLEATPLDEGATSSEASSTVDDEVGTPKRV